MNRCSQIFVIIVFAVIILSSTKGRSAAATFHVSALLNYEFTESYSPGFDVNIIFRNTWGIRYSQIPNMRFGTDSETDSTGGSVSLLQAKGDYWSPMIIRTIDFRSFPPNTAHPLDFLTAYIAAGYNESPITVQKKTYTASNSTLESISLEKEIESYFYSAAFGFLGGERFFVVDAHVLYISGSINDSSFLEKSMEFDHWLIIFGFGVGF